MRLLEASVAAATALSVALLGLLLAAPLLAQPRPEAVVSATAPTATAPAVVPPIGLYLLRGPFSFGPCLALELMPESYPVVDGVEGIATVLTWERGMTGCDSRSDEVRAIDASVARIMSEGADPGVAGYAVRFSLPLDGPAIAVEISILAGQSTPTLLQALETSSPGSFGLVFDRVPSIDPVLDPLPSATPVPGTGLGPIGLYLLAGPFDADGHCLAIELTHDAYPPDGAAGTATILWWEHAGSDPDDPAVCLSRRGEMDELDGSVIPGEPDGPAGPPESYAVRFSTPDAGQEVEIGILAGRSNEDQLQAVRVFPGGTERLVLDRVDELDPPLTPVPSSTPEP